MAARVRYGLNGSTTMPLDQAAEVRLVAEAGFDLIELRAPKIREFLRHDTLDHLKRLLGAHRLTPLSINSLEQCDTRPAREVEAECREMAGWAAAIGCPCVIAVPGFQEAPAPEPELLARGVDRLALLAETAGARGVKVGFEFLGFENCTVNRLQLARSLVTKLGSRQVGLVVDTCHFYLSGEPVELLREFEPGQLLVFHVNDVENLPRAELRDQHRLLPGQGVIPLGEMWAALRERGAIDHASLELFRPAYWHRPPGPFLAEALEAMRRCFPAD